MDLNIRASLIRNWSEMTFLRIVVSLYLLLSMIFSEILSMIFSENRCPLFRVMLQPSMNRRGRLSCRKPVSAPLG
jgi:hypothetical protein